MNKIKQKLAAGQVVTMFNPDFASPRLVEYLGGLGFDVVWIDAERMSYDFERIEEMTRAAVHRSAKTTWRVIRAYFAMPRSTMTALLWL